MSIQTWPSFLPDFIQDGFQSDAYSSVIRTDMTSGIPRQRARFTTDSRVNAVTLNCSGMQWAVFQGFVKNKISSGADFFLGYMKLEDGTRQQYKMRFVAADPLYSTKYVNPNWQVTANVEVIDPNVLTSDALDLLETIDYDFAGLQSAATTLATFVRNHYYLPLIP